MSARPLLPLFALALSACRAGATPASAGGAQAPDRASHLTLVAQPCPELKLGSEALDAANARVFVEVAEVTTPGLPQPLAHWLEGRPVEARSVAHLVAFPNVPTTTPWGACVDAVCSSTEYSLTLTAHLPARASDPMALDLRIEQAAPGADTSTSQADGGSRRVLLDTRLDVQNQQPALLPPSAGVTQGALVITPYLLRRHDDLQRMLQCTAGQTARLPGAVER